MPSRSSSAGTAAARAPGNRRGRHQVPGGGPAQRPVSALAACPDGAPPPRVPEHDAHGRARDARHELRQVVSDRRLRRDPPLRAHGDERRQHQPGLLPQRFADGRRERRPRRRPAARRGSRSERRPGRAARAAAAGGWRAGSGRFAPVAAPAGPRRRPPPAVANHRSTSATNAGSRFSSSRWVIRPLRVSSWNANGSGSNDVYRMTSSKYRELSRAASWNRSTTGWRSSSYCVSARLQRSRAGEHVERVRQRDRVLHRELRPAPDREVRGVRGVAEQHDVPVVPRLAPQRHERHPQRAVRQQSVPAELRREQLLAERDRLLLGRRLQPGALPRRLVALDDERRRAARRTGTRAPGTTRAASPGR